jgi:protein gp37
MTSHTKSELTDRTCNRRTRCPKVSRACDHCYAEQWAKRPGHPEVREGGRRHTKTINGKQAIKWDRVAAGVRPCVFPSLCDVFDDRAPQRPRDDFRHRIEPAANFDRLLLTKRPQNIAGMLPEPDRGAKPPGGWLAERLAVHRSRKPGRSQKPCDPAGTQFVPQSRDLGRLI